MWENVSKIMDEVWEYDEKRKPPEFARKISNGMEGDEQKKTRTSLDSVQG